VRVIRMGAGAGAQACTRRVGVPNAGRRVPVTAACAGELADVARIDPATPQQPPVRGRRNRRWLAIATGPCTVWRTAQQQPEPALEGGWQHDRKPRPPAGARLGCFWRDNNRLACAGQGRAANRGCGAATGARGARTDRARQHKPQRRAAGATCSWEPAHPYAGRRPRGTHAQCGQTARRTHSLLAHSAGLIRRIGCAAGPKRAALGAMPAPRAAQQRRDKPPKGRGKCIPPTQLEYSKQNHGAEPGQR